MDSMKTRHPKLWEQLKEIAEKHDMKVNEFSASAYKDDYEGLTYYQIAISERGYENIGFIFARVEKSKTYSGRDYEVRETICFEQNGKLNAEQLEKISNLLEGKQNG